MGKTKTKTKTAEPSSAPRIINGFHALPVSYSSSTTHYLYLRADKSKGVGSSSSALPSKRTLFVVNLPPDATTRHLRHIFEKAGRIEDVRINKRGFGATEQAEAEAVDEEEDDEAMLSDSDEDEEEQEVTSTTQPQKTKKQLKREAASRPKVPELHALPHLNPRREHAFLRTGSTAHVIFLEEGSVEKALSLASSSKAVKWTDPWEAIQRKVAAARGDDDEDADESSTRRKKPTTALEAQAQALAAQDPPAPVGLAYFLQSYNTHRPSLPALKANADSLIARYTFFRSHPNLNPENQRRASQGYGIGSQVGGITIASWGPEGEPLDEDGFTIVLPGGKYGRSLTQSNTTTSVQASGHANTKMARVSLLDQEAIRLKQEKKMEGLEDFYRFQNREKRKEKLVQMRRQFEADREKVQKLKDQGGGGRRFRPY